ncbi:MAG: hypothetical protein ACR2FU_10610 [Streptosporangiaceae bacterium]
MANSTRHAVRNQRNNPYTLDGLMVSVQHSAAGTAWRWRTELTITATLGAALWRLSVLFTLTRAVILLGALVAVVLAVPGSRRFITCRVWCVVTRHRIQKLCYEARLHTRSGRLPLVLWTRPTKVGVRARILCRAGICAEDFEAHIGELRSACGARDARVTRNPKWSQLVTIDIIRHDTLAATQAVPSPLQAMGPARPTAPPPRRELPPKAARDLARLNGTTPSARNAP